MALLTTNHYVNQANAFISSIRDTRNAFYVFAGSGVAGGPVLANNSIAQYEQTVYGDILFGKLLQASDVSNLIKRYNWTSGTVYAPYDQNDAGLLTKQYYVMTDLFEVYKCIDNNNGSASTIMPSLTTTIGTLLTGDGYTWKYMFTVDSAANTKFTSANFIPVTANTYVSGNAVPGTIDAIKITNGGTGYSVYETGFLRALIDSRTLLLPTTASSSNNYYAGSSIYLKSGFGAGQLCLIDSSDGASKTIHVSPSSTIANYVRFDLANVNGTALTNYSVSQNLDSLNYLYTAGYFNINSTIKQTDTGASGTILIANSTNMTVYRSSATAFALNKPIIDISQSGSLKPGTISIANIGALIYSLVVSSGSGYTSNATVTIVANTADGTAVGGIANAHANSSGKIDSVLVSNNGINYFNEVTATISTPANTTFVANSTYVIGANTGTPNNVIVISSAGSFAANDVITYRVAAGNTAVGGLTSGTSYFVQFANATHIAFSLSQGGSRITLTPGTTQSGHALQGQGATARILSDNILIRGTATQLTDSANGYANGDYIRIGSDANNNIRRVINVVNSSFGIVDYSFINNLTANQHFKMSVAAMPVSITSNTTTATISNTNINSINLKIDTTNTSISAPGLAFIVGEKVDMVDSSNTIQGASGIVAFSNSSALFLSAISGSWTPNFRARGKSSSLQANVLSVSSNPNITVINPVGSFLLGQSIFFNFNNAVTGNAMLISYTNLINEHTEYVIGPTVTIAGDGTNATAIAIVNTSIGSANSISQFNIISSGKNYTYANVTITSNSLFGSNASGVATISPTRGHGYDPITELGGNYVGIDSVFDTGTNEGYFYPSYGSYARVGILQDPMYSDVKVTLANFSRVKLAINTSTGNWTNGEVVVQASTNAAGRVVSGNNSALQLKDVLGTFSTSGNSYIFGYYSSTVANVVTANTIYFSLNTTPEIVSETTSGATGTITSIVSNTIMTLSNVEGQFASNDIIYDAVTNAYATVTSISTANGSRDVTSSFGSKFNQTLRLTLTSSSGGFTNNEIVVQNTSNAFGRIISNVDELDLVLSSSSNNFITNQPAIDATTSANGIIRFSNSTYMKLTSVSNTLSFQVGHKINSGSANAIIQQINKVLLLNSIGGPNAFQPSADQSITGQTTGNYGVCNNYTLITYPELVKNSGRVVYLDNVSAAQRSPTSKEEVKLVIKF